MPPTSLAAIHPARICCVVVCALAFVLSGGAGATAEPQSPSFPGDLAVPAAARTAPTPLADGAPAALVRGRGTGGGDFNETEPNDSESDGDDAADLPFQCHGVISTPGDTDYVKVAIAGGQRVEADAFASIGLFNSPLDPVLVVRSSDGSVVAYNDDWAAPLNVSSHVVFVAPYSGTYSFEVRSTTADFGARYFYILAVWPVTGEVFSTENVEVEPDDDRAEANPVDLPGIHIGNISSPDDADWVSLFAPGSCALIVDLRSTSYIFALDAVIELFDADGTRLWVTGAADGRDPCFNIVLPERGTYYLRVTSRDGKSGPLCAYVLSLSLQDAAGSPHIARLRVDDRSQLKRIDGTGFDARGATVEVRSVAVQGYPSFRNPTTTIKVLPNARVPAGYVVTVRNPDGRRSNPISS